MTPRRHVRLLAVLAVVGLAVPAATASSATPSTLGGPRSPAAAPEENPWLSRRVLSIAHAGGENEAPNETLFAYKRAAALGSDVLEMDVRLTGDDVLVVHHDDTVDRTTDGTGRVADKTYDELFALDHGYKFTPDRSACDDCPLDQYTYRGVRTGDTAPPPGYEADDFTIPTVEKIFDTFPDALLDIEIKQSGADGQAAADELARLIDVYGRADRTVVVSFDDAIVDYFASVAPDVATSPGTDGVTAFFLDRQPQPEHRILQVPPEYDVGGTTVTVVTQEFVDDAHTAGLAVWVWFNGRSQENAEFYEQMIDLGVDGILGAAPQVARDTIDRLGVGWDPSDPEPPPSPGPEPSPEPAPAPPAPAGPTGTPPSSPTGAPPAQPVSGSPDYTG